MCKCTESLPWIYWVILWYFWDNQAHMNSHHYMARDGAALITAFLGAKGIQFGVGEWKLVQRSRGRATHSPVPAMELHLWHSGHLQLTEVILSLCQGAGLVSDPIFQGLSLLRQAVPGRAPGAELCSTMWGLCLVLPVLLVPPGSRSRAALHWYKTALLP